MNEYNSSNDEELSHLCQQALYVEPAPRHIDLNTVPADGSEYIHKERLEASLLKFPSVNQPKTSECSIPKKIDKYWIRKGAQEFCFFANHLSAKRDMLKKKYPQKEYLPLNNAEECCTFCLGSEISDTIYDNYVTCSPAKAHLPLLNYVIHLSNNDVIKLLRHVYKWYKNIGMTDFISLWVFASLACLNKPILDEHEDFLEDFYDDCKSRIKESKGDEFLRLHTISSLIDSYFCIKAYNLGFSLEEI